MIKTVLFDLDGTLLNTIDDLADAGNWVCAQNGWPTFTVAQFKLMVGNGIPKLVERFSPADARTPAQLAATLAQFTARYDAHKEDKTAPYPGIPALLDALNHAVAVGLATQRQHARRAQAQALLARLSPRERDVARQLALGLSNKEVARQLSISDHTVHVHRQRITEKTGSGHAADLARLILRADPQALDEGSAPPPAM